MNKIRLSLCCVLALTGSMSFAQNQPNHTERIQAAIRKYFEPDREMLHLHLNKQSYLNNETIWFKGYVTEKKSAQPYVNTVNVYVQLLDANGKSLKSHLLYAENSTFEGYMTLDNSLPTGLYYLQAYTNYMNNFSEDESSVFAIEIINPTENEVVENKFNAESAQIGLYPESGVFLKGVTNTFGVRLTDCNDRGLAVSDATVKDSKGNLVTTFSTNSFGYGKFDLINAAADIYTVSAVIDGKRIDKLIASPEPEGIAFSVNNYALADKTVVTVRTNPETFDQIKNNVYSLVVQKADVAAVIDFTFSRNEHTLILPSADIPEGLTTMYLIDSNLSKIGERVIFNNIGKPTKSELQIVRKGTDSIVFKGRSPLKMGSLSLSAIPFRADETSDNYSIYGSFLFDGYLKGQSKHLPYFLNDRNRKKQFELDNMLLTKAPKYSWENLIAGKEIAINHPFDNGLGIKGTINTGIDNPKDFKVEMYHFFSKNQTTDVNEKNEFFFNNLVVLDSTTIHFSLLKKNGKSTTLKMYPQLINTNRRFFKPFSKQAFECVTLTSEDVAFPTIADAIELANITVEGAEKREKLENLSRHSNSMSQGYKITDDEASRYYDIFSFIQAHGFDVIQDGVRISIHARGQRSMSGGNSPALFLDDVPIDDASMLRSYSMRNVDEIYINKRGYGGGTTGPFGIIRIYTKKTQSSLHNIAIKSHSLVVKGGFQDYKEFVNPNYDSVQDEGFKKYGTIQWIPVVNTDAEGNFKFAVPNLYQQKIQIKMEGISSEGDLISKTIVIDIP